MTWPISVKFAEEGEMVILVATGVGGGGGGGVGVGDLVGLSLPQAITIDKSRLRMPTGKKLELNNVLKVDLWDLQKRPSRSMGISDPKFVST